jgi:hypothetical protein
MRKVAPLFILCVVLYVPNAGAIDAGQFDELVGYTVAICTHAAGELEGADFDKLIKLDNGMVFEFHSYSYFYAYHPDVVVFQKTVEYQGKTVTLYKLVIGDEDEVFDVSRIR